VKMVDKEAVLEEARRAREGKEEHPGRIYRVITFPLVGRLFGIEVDYVERVVRIRELRVADVPGVPEYVVGVTAVGG